MKIFLLLGMHTKQVILLFLTIFLINSCDTNEPPPPPDGEQPTLELNLEDVSCTEAWIELTTNDLQLPTTITLKQFNSAGDTLSQILNLNTQDSLLYIDSLLPKQSYIFQSSIQSINQSEVKSNELSVTTMDTTSHDFIFETYTFGGTAGSSTLYDVAIINENNIWAVGEIYVADTSQNGYTMYNAVHWDGSEWELKRIRYYGSCSAVEYPPLKAIWAFSENDMVITNGGSIGWYDGNTVNLDCRVNPMLTGAINKIWGSSSSDLYVVGNNGTIVHYNGTLWTRIESGTELNINDIWGDYNEKTGEWEILAVGGNILQGTENERVILRISSSQVQELNTEGTSWPLSTIWFKQNRKYYLAGSGGKFEKHNLIEKDWKPLNTMSGYLLYKIRGNRQNDVVGAGAFGEVLHFNGISWKSYIIETGLNSGIYYSVGIKNNTLVVVGFSYQSAVITIGKRIN
jgi:hypothetical protein